MKFKCHVCGEKEDRDVKIQIWTEDEYFNVCSLPCRDKIKKELLEQNREIKAVVYPS